MLHKKMTRPSPMRLFCTLALALVLISCATTDKNVGAVPQKSLGQKVAIETLMRAQSAYDNGDYKGAVHILRGDGVSPFAAADAKTKLEAMKLEAFSYCLQDQAQRCLSQFQQILRAYPEFELSVAERSHPQWGPAFDWAKRAPLRR